MVWSDADPAGIAYTGRFADFALEAIEAWSEARLGFSWYGGAPGRPRAPFVHVQLDIAAPLRPGDWLLCEVRPLAVGRTSFTTAVIGRAQDGAPCFAGRFTQVCVDAQLAPMPVPDALRQAIGRERPADG